MVRNRFCFCSSAVSAVVATFSHSFLLRRSRLLFLLIHFFYFLLFHSIELVIGMYSWAGGLRRSSPELTESQESVRSTEYGVKERHLLSGTGINSLPLLECSDLKSKLPNAVYPDQRPPSIDIILEQAFYRLRGILKDSSIGPSPLGII